MQHGTRTFFLNLSFNSQQILDLWGSNPQLQNLWTDKAYHLGLYDSMLLPHKPWN